MAYTPSSAFADTKPHYPILDGFRGVAALTVVWFHIFEAFATSHLDQIINHGYLAVDFFFILSGFVIGYAYDDRWRKNECERVFQTQDHPPPTIGCNRCTHWSSSVLHTGMLRLGCLQNLFGNLADGNYHERSDDSGNNRCRDTRCGRNVPVERPHLVTLF